MLNSFIQNTLHIYITCQATDFREQIDSLVALVTLQFKLDPFSESCAFVFCNKKRSALKILRYDRNGFVLVNKKLLEDLKVQWPKTPDEVKEVTQKQIEWLLEGLEMESKKAHHPIEINNKNCCF